MAASQPNWTEPEWREVATWQRLASQGLWHFEESAMSEQHPTTVCASLCRTLAQNTLAGTLARAQLSSVYWSHMPH